MPETKSKVKSQKSKVQSKSDKKVQEKVNTLAAEAVMPKKAGLTISVRSIKGTAAGTIDLPKDIFGAKINKPLMTQAVLVYLSNQRAGSAHTKGRGEVDGSTRKIYRQKGTGRARHGAITAPIFVGGGIAHGPKSHDFTKKLSQKMKKAALFSALSTKQKDGAVAVVSGLLDVPVKTKEIAKGLKALGLSGSILLVVSNDGKMENAKKSARNLHNVSLIMANQLNTYEVLKHKTLLFAKEALSVLEQTFMKEDNK